MNLKKTLVALAVLAVLASAIIVGSLTQAQDDKGGSFVGPGQEEQVVPIGTTILPDGSIEVQEGVGEFELITPDPQQK